MTDRQSKSARGSQSGAAEHASDVLSVAGVVGSLGIVFGDIATSPLYAVQECLAGKHGVAPEPVNVFGVVSMILWSLLIVVTLKYLVVLMRADNRGEGGIMALLALIPRRMREKRPGVLGPMTILVVIGAALLFGDGIITPAISVLSAVEGLRVVTPRLEPVIVPLTVVILVALFAIQKRGSGGLGRVFGPVMILWLLVAGALGVIAIAKAPRILGAFSPHHAIAFAASDAIGAFRVLGGVVLSVTGGEALYADMGHFGRRPIRFGWVVVALPNLMASYLGQGATILEEPGAAVQPFYAMVPSGAASIPFVLLGTAATVIASQALISGVFSLVRQSMLLGYFPRLRVEHTAKESIGQIYVPFMNAFLGVACIVLVLVFRESSKLAAAFGLAVSGTMAVTSIAFYGVARNHFRWGRPLAITVVAFFLVFDTAFFAANTLKIVDGGYVPVVVGACFVVVMIVWARGRGLLGAYFRERSEPTEAFVASLPSAIDQRLKGVGVVMTASAESIPPVLLRMVRRFRTMHETVLLTTVLTEEIPYVAEPRVEVTPIAAGLHRVVVRYGFMESPAVHDVMGRVLPQVAPGVRPEDVTYVLGHERFLAGPEGKMGPLAERIFALLSQNAFNPTDYYAVPPAQVVELGARVDL